MICEKGNPDFTKSSVFSLASIATAITENMISVKKTAERYFLIIYQSRIFIQKLIAPKVAETRDEAYTNCANYTNLKNDLGQLTFDNVETRLSDIFRYGKTKRRSFIIPNETRAT